MTPFLGQRVIVLGIYSNGANEAPGIVTRIWGAGDPEHCLVRVNVIVFPDAELPVPRTSVRMAGSRRAAAESGENFACYSAEPLLA